MIELDQLCSGFIICTAASNCKLLCRDLQGIEAPGLMLSPAAALEDSSDAEDPPAKRDESSKESRRTALAKTLETVRARREALARETSATRRAV